MKQSIKIRIGMIIFIIILIVIVIILIPKNYDDLGGYKIDSYSSKEYFISLDKEGDTLVTNGLGIVHKGTRITYIYPNDSLYFGYGSLDSPIIEPFIYSNEIRYNNKFILLVQHPITGWGEKYTYSKEIYKDTTIVYGWKIPIWFFIINKLEDIIYGPYTLDQYLEKRKEIGIPDSLKLRLENHDELYNFKY